MGVVKVLANVGEGEYDIEIVKDVRRAKVALNSLDEKIDKNNELVVKFQIDLDQLTDRINTTTSEFQDHVDDYDNRITQIKNQQQALADVENAILDQNKADLITLENNTYINTEATLTDDYNFEVSLRENAILAALPQDKPALQASLDQYIINFAESSDVRYGNYLKRLDAIETNAQKLRSEAEERQRKELEAAINTENNKYDSFVNLTQGNLSKLKDERGRIERDIAMAKLKSTDASKLKETLTKIVNDKVLKRIWIVDYDLELAVNEKYVTVEIERAADKSLIAPRTYEPVDADVELLDDKLQELAEEYDKINTRRNIANGELANNKIEQSQLLPFAKSPAIQAQLLALSNVAIILASKVSALALLLEGVTNKINRTNEEKTRIQTLVTASGIDLNPITIETTQHQPVMSSSAEATFFNKAILPAVQRWLPTFRHATLNTIDFNNDTCTLTIPFSKSIENDLPINEGVSEYIDVPIKYGACNAAAFTVGDNVIVKFSKSWKTPVVIGFKDHPQPCGHNFVNTDGGIFKTAPFPFERHKLRESNEPILYGELDSITKFGAISWGTGSISSRYTPRAGLVTVYFRGEAVYQEANIVGCAVVARGVIIVVFKTGQFKVLDRKGVVKATNTISGSLTDFSNASYIFAVNYSANKAVTRRRTSPVTSVRVDLLITQSLGLVGIQVIGTENFSFFQPTITGSGSQSVVYVNSIDSGNHVYVSSQNDLKDEQAQGSVEYPYFWDFKEDDLISLSIVNTNITQNYHYQTDFISDNFISSTTYNISASTEFTISIILGTKIILIAIVNEVTSFQGVSGSNNGALYDNTTNSANADHWSIDLIGVDLRTESLHYKTSHQVGAYANTVVSPSTVTKREYIYFEGVEVFDDLISVTTEQLVVKAEDFRTLSRGGFYSVGNLQPPLVADANGGGWNWVYDGGALMSTRFEESDHNTYLNTVSGYEGVSMMSIDLAKAWIKLDTATPVLLNSTNFPMSDTTFKKLGVT